MTRLIAILIVLVALAGCDKKQEQTEAAKATETAAAAAETAAKTAEAAAATAEAAAETAEAATEAANAATAAAAAMGAGEAPEVMKKMAEHIKGITAAIKDNMADCKKAAEAADKYVTDNKADFDAFKKYADSIPDAEKAKMALQFQALVTPLIQEYVAVQMQFAQKCANEAKALAEIMKKMKTK